MPFDLNTAVPVDADSKSISTTTFDPTTAVELNPEPIKETPSISSFLRSIFKASPIEQINTLAEQSKYLREGGKNLDTFTAEREKDIIQEGVLRQVQAPMTLAIGSSALVKPLATAAMVGGFSIADHFFNARRWIEEKAPQTNPTIKDVVEIVDFVAKGAALGGGFAAFKKFSIDRANSLNMPKAVEIVPEQVSVIKDNKVVTETLGIEQKHINASINNNIPVKVPIEKIVDLAEKPEWEEVKNIVSPEVKTEMKPQDFATAEEYVASFRQMYHQTTEEGLKGIKESGFKIIRGKAGLGDELPVGINTKTSPSLIRLEGKEQLGAYLPKNAKVKDFANRESVVGYLRNKSDEYNKIIFEKKATDVSRGRELDALEKEELDIRKDTSISEADKKLRIEKLNRLQDELLEKWKKETDDAGDSAAKIASKILLDEGLDAIYIKEDVGGVFGNQKTDNLIVLKEGVLKPKSQLTAEWQAAQKAKGTRPEDFNTAEEYVASKKQIFHGTDKVFNDFDVKKSNDGSIWFTDNKVKIENGEVSATGKGQIMERFIDENKLKMGGWEEADKFLTDELIAKGYDGLKLVDEGETTYQIFNPEKLQTKSQLTAEWEAAQKAKSSSVSGGQMEQGISPQALQDQSQGMKVEQGQKVESEVGLASTPTIPPEQGAVKPIEPEPIDPVRKVIEALKGAKPVRKIQEKLYSKERGQRMAQALASRTGGERGFYKELGALKGELPKAEFEAIRDKLKQSDIDSLFNMITDNQQLSFWETITARKALGKLFGQYGGVVPQKSEIALLNKVFGNELTEALIEKMPMWEKFQEGLNQVLNIPRSIMSSFDLSAPLRQGVFLIGRKEFAPAFKDMFSFFGKEENLTALKNEIASRENYDLMKESKLALTDMDVMLEAREEAFMSNLAEKIPVVGGGIRASGRAYVGFLNKLRADVFDSMIKDAERLGLDPKENRDLAVEIAKFVNTATGRGDLGALSNASVSLNNIFFSPRLIASRISLLNPSYYIKMSPYVRGEALKSLLTFASLGGTIVGLSSLAGAKVGTDPRSSDFGKIILNRTRIDVWGGFQQYARMIGQLISGKYVSSKNGRVITLGEGYKPLTRLDIIQRQLESKLAPVASFITTLLKGQTWDGKKVDVSKEVINRMTPMVLNDLMTVIKDDPKMIPLEGLGLFGVGINTYEKR